jgi:hypothetical protein
MIGNWMRNGRNQPYAVLHQNRGGHGIWIGEDNFAFYDIIWQFTSKLIITNYHTSLSLPVFADINFVTTLRILLNSPNQEGSVNCQNDVFISQ